MIGDYGQELNPEYWFAYDDLPNNSTIYGRLYTYPVVVKASDICPDGWHVPDLAEWTEMIDNLSSDGGNAGGKLRESGTAHWRSPNTGATNSTGFTALPGGTRSAFGHFTALGHSAFFWTSTSTFAIRLYYNADTVKIINDWHIGYGCSVRCIKD